MHLIRKAPVSEGTALSCLLSAAIAALFTFWTSPSYPDFAIMWAGPQIAHPYQPELIRSVISWPAEQFTPFVYPPNAILLFQLFTLVSLSLALLLWTAIGGGLLGLCTRWAPALFFTPPVLWALPGGQTSLVLGCLIFLAFRYSERTMLSGALFGIALTLKPQLAFVAPAALVFSNWRVSAYAVSIFLLSVITSVALYGPNLWLEWLNSLSPWLTLHSSNEMLLRNEIAHGLPIWLRGCVAFGGVAYVAVERDKLIAFTFAVCTALIASPHAMGYEFAMLAPALVGLAGRPGPIGLVVLALILTPALIWMFPGLLPFHPRLIAVAVLAMSVANPKLLLSAKDLKALVLLAESPR